MRKGTVISSDLCKLNTTLRLLVSCQDSLQVVKAWMRLFFFLKKRKQKAVSPGKVSLLLIIKKYRSLMSFPSDSPP